MTGEAEQTRAAEPARSGSRAARLAPWAVMLAGAVFTIVLVARIDDEVFYSGDGGLKALLVRQFAGGRVACDLRLQEEPWVRRLWAEGAYPFAPPFVYEIKGREYLSFPVTFPFISAPFYQWFGYHGLYILPLGALWLTWLVFLAVCRRAGLSAVEQTAALGALVFASPLTLYGAMFWEYTPAVLLAFAGLAAALPRPGERASPGRHAVGGTLLGLSVWLRPECLCVTGAVVVADVVRARREGAARATWALAAAATVMIGAFGLFNVWVYGHPLGAHSLQVVEGFDLRRHIVEAARYCLWLNGEFVTYVPAALFVVIVLVLPGFGRPEALSSRLRYLLTVLVIVAVAVPLIIPHPGGRAWGPRFLLCSVPVAVLAAGLLLRDVRRTAGRGGRVGAWGVFAAALVGGVVLNTVVGGEKLSRNYATRVAPALEYVGESEHDVVVVSHQWVAQELEALFGQKHFLRVNDPSEMPRLAAALAEHGQDGFLFLWARYDESPGEPQVVFEDEQVRVTGPLVGRLGWNFDVYDCLIEPAATSRSRE